MLYSLAKGLMGRKNIALFMLAILIINMITPCFIVNASVGSVSLEAVDGNNNTIAGPIIGELGEIITIYLKINEIQNFAGAHVNLAFDSNVLQNVNEIGQPISYVDSTGSDLNILRNDNFNPFNSYNRVNNTVGSIEFARSYTYLEHYRSDNNPETTGRMAKLRFKVMQTVTTSVYFQDTTQIVLQGGHDGTLVTNWDDGNNILGIDNYDVDFPASNPLIINPPVAPTASSISINSPSGLYRVGKQLTGSYFYDDLNGDNESGSTFRWLRSDTVDFSVYEAIDGAIALNYTPTTLDVGKYIRFEVTPKTDVAPFEGVPAQSSSVGPIEPLPAPAAPEAQNVSVSGNAFVGNTLTGSYTYFDINEDIESGSIYKWYRSATVDFSVYEEISGADATQYILTSLDLNKYIKFEVTPKTTVAPTVGIPIKSPATAEVMYMPTAPTASNVSITGTAEIGETLTGNYTYFDLNDDLESGTTFRWLSSSDAFGPYVAISEAYDETYTIQASDFGKYIKFEVTPRNGVTPTIGTAVQSSATTKIVYTATAPVVSNVTISGIYYVGQKLTGSYTFFDLNGDPDSSTYQWLRSDTADGTFTPIPGATLIEYTIIEDDAWKYIKLEVTAMTNVPPALGNVDLSAATTQMRFGAVEPMAQNIRITHTVNGEVYDAVSSVVYAGELLTGTYDYFDLNKDPESGSTYRWLRSNTANGTYSPIFGATSQTYMLTHADLGKYIKFEVTPKTYEPPQIGTPVLSSAIGPIGYLKVSGYVSPDFELSYNANWMDKYYHKSNFKIEITSGTAWVSVVTDNEGYFEFYLPVGQPEDYTIRISKSNYLMREFVKRIDAATGNVVLSSVNNHIDMWTGDFEPDMANAINSIIDINDINILRQQYDSIISEDNSLISYLDINKDGVVGLVDIVIICRHFESKVLDYPEI